MINQFMFGIRSADGSALGGHVQNMETKERWGWRKDQIESFETTSVMEWLPNKIGAFRHCTCIIFVFQSRLLPLQLLDFHVSQECSSCRYSHSS